MLQSEYEAKTQIAVDDLHRLNEKLRRHGKVPTDASAEVVASKYFKEITELHVQEFPIPEFEVYRRLNGKSKVINYFLRGSYVLLVENEVKGFFLTVAQPISTEIFIYSVSISTDLRRTWATAFLKYEALRKLKAMGIYKVRFQALANNRDTIKHAERVGAKTISHTIE